MDDASAFADDRNVEFAETSEVPDRLARGYASTAPAVDRAPQPKGPGPGRQILEAVRQADEPAPKRRSCKRLLLVPILLGLLGAAGWYGHYWYETGRYLEETDDAYLRADNVTVSPKVGGYVAEVHVTDNQRVRAGDVLARIDDRDFKAAVNQAKADVAQARAAIDSLDAQIALQQSSIDQARADVATAEAALNFAQQQYDRAEALAQRGVGTVQQAQQTGSDLLQKRSALIRARAAQEAATRQIAVLRAQRESAVATLAGKQAALEQAELNLGYTAITAPIDGVVGDRSLRLGLYLQPGTQILTLVPMDKGLYVVANFKETQVGHMVQGEPVEISVDALPGHVFKGRLDSIAPGTGAQFALLPTDNATGNFTKIVQRVPVKILLDGRDAALARLRPGLSVQATVDTRDEEHIAARNGLELAAREGAGR